MKFLTLLSVLSLSGLAFAQEPAPAQDPAQAQVPVQDPAQAQVPIQDPAQAQAQAPVQVGYQQSAPDEGGPNEASIIRSCVVPNTIALTLDDGPTEHTLELLDTLDAAGIKATFYVNCNNLMKDVNGEPTALVKPYLQEIAKRGHEIGSHTYNHACLTAECLANNPLMKLMDTKETFTEQIVENENFIFDAIGKYPATYRAPFGDGMNPGGVNATLKQWLYELGYPYAIHWDIETRDMENANTSDDLAFQVAQEGYNSATGQKNTLITLQHVIPVTINKIIPWIVNEWAPAHPEMKFVKVSECLGLTDADVYKTAPGPKTDFKKVNGDSNNPSTDDAKSLFTGLVGTTVIVLIAALLNSF